MALRIQYGNAVSNLYSCFTCSGGVKVVRWSEVVGFKLKPFPIYPACQSRDNCSIFCYHCKKFSQNLKDLKKYLKSSCFLTDLEKISHVKLL